MKITKLLLPFVFVLMLAVTAQAQDETINISAIINSAVSLDVHEDLTFGSQGFTPDGSTSLAVAYGAASATTGQTGFYEISGNATITDISFGSEPALAGTGDATGESIAMDYTFQHAQATSGGSRGFGGTNVTDIATGASGLSYDLSSGNSVYVEVAASSTAAVSANQVPGTYTTTLTLSLTY